MRSVRFGVRSLPIAVAAVTVVAYGLLLPLTGFYWDDWPFAWTARFLGPASFIPAFRGFRPFLGPIFFLTTSLIPTNPLLWQILALVIRSTAAVSAWFLLDQVWPSHRRLTIPAALLLLVFPGYSQHWVALTHINQEWIPFIFYLLSLAVSMQAFRAVGPSLRLTLLAVIFLMIGLFPTEYFVGLEPLRFVFLWVVATEATPGIKARFVRALRAWRPCLAIWMLDLAWLIYYYRSGIYVSYGLTAGGAFPPLDQSLLLFADALWKAGLFTWFQIVPLAARSIVAPSTQLAIGLALVSFAAASLYLLRLRVDTVDPPATPPEHSATSLPQDSTTVTAFGVAAVAIGAIGILLGRIPSFAAGLPLTLQSSYDRFMISMMLGGSLFIVGLVALLIRNSRARAYALAALLALGVGQQFLNANIFRRDWEGQQQIYWELVWRIPGLQPGTALVTQQMPLDYETDLSMTAALNWIYSPRANPSSLQYALVYTEKRLGGTALPNLDPDTTMQLQFRTVGFTGNTSDIVAVYVPRNGCLRVLDPNLRDLDTYSGYPASVTGPIGISNPSLIIADAAAPQLPNPPFGAEPSHTWCYYYEKAELARQLGDWQQIVTLGSAASKQGFTPQDPIEWLPFIEAYARAGELPLAERITRKTWAASPKAHHGICVVWNRLQTGGPDATEAAAAGLLGEFGCGH